MQFSAAYDVYLEILYCVDQRLQRALSHDTPHWRLLNSCPPCFYKLHDEPALDFDWLISIDGNNSLKRWDSTIYGTTAREDSRKARSDYWVDPGAVNNFKDEVKTRRVSLHSSLQVCIQTLSFRQTRSRMTGRMSPLTQIFQEHSHV
jgi:hypothetical protein